MEVAARAQSDRKGRLYPSFGVGLNGVSGYRLLCSPNKREIELTKGDEVKASKPYKWKAGSCTRFRLQIRKARLARF